MALSSCPVLIDTMGGSQMEKRCPVALDTTGSNLYAEAAALRAEGPATQVELPGGVVVWSVNSYDVAKSVLTNSQVTKSGRTHWRAFVDGEIPMDWEMISWI